MECPHLSYSWENPLYCQREGGGGEECFIAHMNMSCAKCPTASAVIQQSSCGIELLQQNLGLLYKNAQIFEAQTSCGRKLVGLYSLFLLCVFGIIRGLGLLSFVKRICALNGEKTVLEWCHGFMEQRKNKVWE